MKKIISLALSALMLASALASCAPAQSRLDEAITVASSAAQANAKWLDTRLETFPTEVIVGIGSSDTYGVDMTDFENDGYILRSIGEETFIFGKTADGLDRAVRAYAKAAEKGTAENLDETYHEGYRVEKLTIAGNDISEYTIYYPADNNAGMLFGVSELQRLVKKACGVDLPSKEGAPEGKYIEFRFLYDDTFENGGFKYNVENGNLIIEGVENFGCPNGVYFFLENECGWDGLTYGDSILAESEHVDVAEGESFVGNPRFEYFFPYINGNPWVSDVSSPNSAQTNGGEFSRAYNGYRFLSCHGIQNNKWISEEYWSLESNDQPCYTNDEVYDEAFENIHSYVEKWVAAGRVVGKDIRFIDVAHPDVGNFCFCKTCLKVFKEENRSHSGAVVRFINKLVEDMSVDFDGIKYGIFAYWGTQKPCKTAPDEDVVVTFCTDRCCANHPLNSNECSEGAFYKDTPNQVFCEWIEGWIELNGNLYMWHYGLDNGFGSNNYMDTLYEDLLYFDEVGIQGVFMEFEFTGFSLNRVTNHLGYAVNWDRDMTKEEYIAERDRLLEKEYGDGWEYVSECIYHWTESENRNGCWHCWAFGTQIPELYAPYTAEHYDMVYSLAKKAIALANSEAQEIRCVKLLALLIYQASVCTYFTAYDNNDTDKLAFIEERWTEMITLLQKCGINIDTIAGISPHGLATTCEEEAWTEWRGYRDIYSFAEGENLLPPPEKYR